MTVYDFVKSKEFITLMGVMLLIAVIVAGITLGVSSCGKAEPEQGQVLPQGQVVQPGQTQEPVSEPEPEYVPPTEEELRLMKAQQIVAGMSTEDKVGQLLLVRSNGVSGEEFAALAAKCRAGGVVLFAPDVKEKNADQLKALIASLQSACGGKLLVCVDEEGGTVVRVSSNPNLRESKFLSPQKIYASGGMDAIIADAHEKSRFLLDFGINVNFAPVADVVTDSSGFLYSRAFGRDADATAEYVRNVVTAMGEEGIGCTIKHFPGYGNSSGDTHNGLVVVDTDAQTIRSRELTPFAAGIQAGADSVMVTHSIMTAIDPDRPASLSPAVMSLLRDELGFEGVIVSDGMDMGAIKEYGEGRDVCVTAFLAGIDLMCTPTSPTEAYNALLAAVNDGTITAERLDESVLRIVLWKIQLGLYED